MKTTQTTENDIAEEEVRLQLESILAGATFATSRQLSSFLRFVVTEKLAGRAGEIKQYTVATKAFGRNADFDATTDPIVRITAQRLRRALDDYYADEGAQDGVRIHIPKGTYVPSFERIAPGEMRATDGQARSSANPHGGGAVTHAFEHGPRLAVLPFVTTGSTAQNGHIGDGFSEQIIAALTQFQTFTIFGPLSRERMAADQTDVMTFCREHGVRFVLEGHLRWFGNTLRVNVKVTDIFTRVYLWSLTRDIVIADESLLEVEDELTRQIAAAVASSDGVVTRTLSRERLDQAGADFQTFDAILRARHAMKMVTKPALDTAIAALEDAHLVEPDNVFIMSSLADLYATTYMHGLHDNLQRVAEAKALAQRAIRLSPDSPSCHAGLAIVLWADRDGEACLREARIARRLNPYNASLIGGLSNLFALFGAYQEGIEMAEIGLKLNPHSPPYLLYTHFIAYFATGDYEAAYRITHDFNMPDFFCDPLFRAIAASRLGLYREARAELRQLHALRPDILPRFTELMQRTMGLPRHAELFAESLARAGFAPDSWWEVVEIAAPEVVPQQQLSQEWQR